MRVWWITESLYAVTVEQNFTDALFLYLLSFGLSRRWIWMVLGSATGGILPVCLGHYKRCIGKIWATTPQDRLHTGCARCLADKLLRCVE
jgi:hypothetical protein